MVRGGRTRGSFANLNHRSLSSLAEPAVYGAESLPCGRLSLRARVGASRTVISETSFQQRCRSAVARPLRSNKSRNLRNTKHFLENGIAYGYHYAGQHPMDVFGLRPIRIPALKRVNHFGPTIRIN
jgi:hypothetical protein